MAINRALMNRQMYNMGGPSLQAGAPDITLTGDMRPTYSAMRKQRLAYGGIAGLDGRKKYGIGSWFQENVMDPIKENPVTSAIIGGGLLNQFGLPDFLPDVGVFDDDFGQNFLGNLISKIPGTPDYVDTVFGGTQGINPKDLIFGLPDDPYTILGEEGGDQRTYAEQLKDFVVDSAGNYVNKITGEVFGTSGTNPSNMTNAQKGQLELEKYKRRNLNVDLAKALAAGSAAGAYVESQPKDELPTDTTGLDIPAIAQAARGTDAQGAAAGLRFLPDQVTRAANGGRIGYANGMGVDPMTPDELPYARDVMPMENRMPLEKIIEAYMKSQEGMYFLRDEISRGKSMEQIINQMKKELEQQNPSSMEDMDPSFTIPGPSQSPNATPIPEGMMINPRKTMEFRDVNQNGIPDRDEGIYSKDRDFVPKKDYPNMDPGFTIPRVTKAEGGLMNLGGMEKDYREEGGFVPIGGKEKADDVPARLSKNEFVFTADAVRNAGGGDIDQGAQVMEKLMRNLESGGQVSEESQGLEGAREMFETSQRLEKRII